ncbi:MAG: hypothetical protein AAGA54_29505 [Myxococcota bacterium]
MSSSSPDSAENPEAMQKRIADELAALGEEPLGPDEVAFAMGGGGLRSDLDVSTVETLARWAETPEDSDSPDAEAAFELSELARARVWRTVELRASRAEGEGEAEVQAPSAQPETGSGRGVLLGFVVAAVAVAAGVLLVPVLTPDAGPSSTPDSVAEVTPSGGPSAEELEMLSLSARSGLDALDRLSGEPTGTARAEAMAQDYADRLASQRGRG